MLEEIRGVIFGIYNIINTISHYGYDDINMFFGDLYGYQDYIFIFKKILIISVIDTILFFIGKYIFKRFKIKEFKNIILYTYIFRFIPFFGTIGALLSGLNNKKGVLKHVLLSYIVFIIFSFYLYNWLDSFYRYTIVIGQINDPGEANSMVMYFTNYFTSIITSITLFIIGIFLIIGFYLGKIKKN